MTYQEILTHEIEQQLNTDLGMLKAYWNTVQRLIEQKAPRSECLKFLQKAHDAFGEWKAEQMKGELIDANLL